MRQTPSQRARQGKARGWREASTHHHPKHEISFKDPELVQSKSYEKNQPETHKRGQVLSHSCWMDERYAPMRQTPSRRAGQGRAGHGKVG